MLLRRGSVLRNDLFQALQRSGAWRNGTSFGINDLEALLTVAYEEGVDHRSWFEALSRLNWEVFGPPEASRTSLC